MKNFIVLLFILVCSSSSWAQEASDKKTSGKLPGINKSPKAIFLIKRAKVDSDIGEPVLYPFERQIRNLYYDVRGGVLRND